MKIVSTLSKKMRIGLTSEGGLVVETLLRGQQGCQSFRLVEGPERRKTAPRSSSLLLSCFTMIEYCVWRLLVMQ